MATSKTYKRNDTDPPIVITCLDGLSAMNLTNATSAKFLMGTIDAAGVSAVKVNQPMSFDADRSTGKVSYAWAPTDLDTAATYKAEVQVTWNTGKKQTFPSDSYLEVNVIADVGD